MRGCPHPPFASMKMKLVFKNFRLKRTKMENQTCCLCSFEALDGDHLEDHIVQKHSDIFKNDQSSNSKNNQNGMLCLVSLLLTHKVQI
jgi:hypothetical protein